MGSLSEVVPDDGLAGRAAEWAAQLAAMPTRGIGMSKRLLADSADRARVRAGGQAAGRRHADSDFREGVDAFLGAALRRSLTMEDVKPQQQLTCTPHPIPPDRQR